MKVVEKVIRINKELIKVNQFVEMEDTLSCDKFRGIIRNVSDSEVSLLRLKDGEIVTLSAEQLEHYEVRYMRLGYVEDYRTKMSPKPDCIDELIKNNDKQEGETRKDNTYENNPVIKALKELYGDRVKFETRP